MDISTPLSTAPFHILLALIDGPSHGYAIMQRVADLSDSQVRLGTGSFYRHLARLLDDGLVAEAPAPRAQRDPRRGTHYRLTTAGREALAAERQRLAALVAALDGLTVRREPV